MGRPRLSLGVTVAGVFIVTFSVTGISFSVTGFDVALVANLASRILRRSSYLPVAAFRWVLCTNLFYRVLWGEAVRNVHAIKRKPFRIAAK